MARLNPTAQDRTRARHALLRLLNGEYPNAQLLSALVELAQTEEEKCQARDTLFGLMAGPNKRWVVRSGIDGLVRLNLTPNDKAQAREALLGLLDSPFYGTVAAQLAAGLLRLTPTAEDKSRARHALLRLLVYRQGATAARLVAALVELDSTARDLANWQTWAVIPTIELRAAARRNSALTA